MSLRPSPATEEMFDDAASALGLHDGRHRLGEAHRPRQVDGHDLVPHLERQVIQVVNGIALL